MSRLCFLQRIKNAGYFKKFFLGRRWVDNQRKWSAVWCITLHSKIIELICCARRLLNVTKSRLNNRICQHFGLKTNTVTPSFFNISLSCNNSIRSFIGNLWRVLLLGNHLKLFLDIVPSSAEEATRAMRGQQVDARKNGGNVILYVSISFQNRDGFWTLGRLFGRPGFRLFCAHLAVLFMRF